MTLWMASPPEVHAALLVSGPGPGALLAAASGWIALGAEYTATAAELSALLDAVQAGPWQGPSAERYAAAHGPYLAWLADSATDAGTSATLHQAVAGAYSGALAAMPTTAELATNHVVHGALVGTNFFGINTIPIALNEADYARMWIQAAETMTAYQAVSDSALAAMPAGTPAPPILAADTPPVVTSWQDQLAQWITQYNMGFADPLAKLLFYPDGYPMSPMPLVNALKPLFAQIPGIAPGLASALAWTVFHNLMLVYPLLQASPLLFAAAIPAVLAATGATGLAGLAGLAAIPGVSATVADLPAAAGTPAPAGGVTMASSTAGGIETTLSHAPATAAAPSAPAAPSTAAMAGGGSAGGGGGGVGFGPGFYAAGAMYSSAAGKASGRRARRSEEPGSDDAAAPADPALAREQARRRRRRTAGIRGHGNEYMDMNIAVQPDWALASDRGAGPLGFTGASARPGLSPAAGLTAVAETELSGGPSVPMLPSSWPA